MLRRCGALQFKWIGRYTPEWQLKVVRSIAAQSQNVGSGTRLRIVEGQLKVLLYQSRRSCDTTHNWPLQAKFRLSSSVCS